jgi:hypothetical protein
MRVLFAVMLAVSVAACSRKVEVNTAPTPATSDVSLQVTNNVNQAVNVYVTNSGNDTFVGQVAANSSQHLAVSGITSGTTVTLKARTADGTRTYTKDGVTLSGNYAWTVP